MLGTLILSAVIILIFCENILFNSGSQKDDRRILVLAFIMLLFIFGCRSGYADPGGDVDIYYHYYTEAIECDDLQLYIDSHNDWMESGYLLLNWLFARIIPWPQFILFFEAAFCCGITLRFIYKYSDDVLLSLLGFMSLGVMGFYLTGFRQSMAISLCLLALEMADRKKMVTFSILVLIAVSFHGSAIAFMPAYFLIRIRANKVLVIIEIALLAFIGQLIPFIIKLGNEVFERNYVGEFAGNRTGGIINILIGAFIVFIMMYQIEDYNLSGDGIPNGGKGIFVLEENDSYKFLYILIMGIGLYVLRYKSLIIERVSFYYLPVLFVLLPDAIKNGIVEKDRQFVRVFCMVGMMLLIYWRLGKSDYAFFLS